MVVRLTDNLPDVRTDSGEIDGHEQSFGGGRESGLHIGVSPHYIFGLGI